MTYRQPPRCVICAHQISMREETRDRRYWDEQEQGWAHNKCSPDAPKSDEQRLLDGIFGADNHQKQKERVATRIMAESNGHHLAVEKERNRGKRLNCTCGYQSHWMNGGQIAEARDAHLKWAGVYEEPRS